MQWPTTAKREWFRAVMGGSVPQALAAGFPMEPLRTAYQDAVESGSVRRSALQRDGAAVRAYVDGSASVGRTDLIDRLTRLLEGA